MNPRFRTYGVYSVAVAVVWGVLLALAAARDTGDRYDKVRTVFLGFSMGWLSATIARYVYPPPRKYRRAREQPC